MNYNTINYTCQCLSVDFYVFLENFFILQILLPHFAIWEAGRRWGVPYASEISWSYFFFFFFPPKISASTIDVPAAHREGTARFGLRLHQQPRAEGVVTWGGGAEVAHIPHPRHIPHNTDDRAGAVDGEEGRIARTLDRVIEARNRTVDIGHRRPIISGCGGLSWRGI